MIEFHFFGMPIKTLGSLGKIRVGRITGNTHIFSFGPKGLPFHASSALPLPKDPITKGVRPLSFSAIPFCNKPRGGFYQLEWSRGGSFLTKASNKKESGLGS